MSSQVLVFDGGDRRSEDDLLHCVEGEVIGDVKGAWFIESFVGEEDHELDLLWGRVAEECFRTEC